LKKTKGQIEDALGKAFIQFYVQKLGTGPKNARVYILEDMIIARLTGRLHPLEDFLIHEKKGIELVKHIRKAFQEATIKDLNKVIKKHIECEVISFHSDSSTKTGERFEIFIVDRNLSEYFKNS